MHYDFEGNLAEGELICNNYIAQDLLEIFYELYLNEYQLERVTLIENYGDKSNNIVDVNIIDKPTIIPIIANPIAILQSTSFSFKSVIVIIIKQEQIIIEKTVVQLNPNFK